MRILKYGHEKSPNAEKLKTLRLKGTLLQIWKSPYMF